MAVSISRPRGQRVSGRAENSSAGGRLRSRITYVDGPTELMDFEIFTPEQLAARAEAAGLHTLEASCWWDRRRPPDPDEARYQMTLERRLGDDARIQEAP